jgi:sec-independent protein translocase protein TatA
MSFGITEILIVVAIVVLLFGSTLIPKLVRSLGSVRDEFTSGTRDSTP